MNDSAEDHQKEMPVPRTGGSTESQYLHALNFLHLAYALSMYHSFIVNTVSSN